MCLFPRRALTLYCKNDRLAGFVLAVLVVDGLRVVTACVGRHGGEDDQRVVQGDRAARTDMSSAYNLKFCTVCLLTPPPIQISMNQIRGRQLNSRFIRPKHVCLSQASVLTHIGNTREFP